MMKKKKNCVKEHVYIHTETRNENYLKKEKNCYFLIMSLYDVKAWSDLGMHVRKKEKRKKN